jgi:hypothetical protein
VGVVDNQDIDSDYHLCIVEGSIHFEYWGVEVEYEYRVSRYQFQSSIGELRC